MPDSNNEKDSSQNESIFHGDQKKQDIFSEVKNDLRDEVDKIHKKHSGDKKDYALFGSVFESVARQENRLDHQETAEQTLIRELVEEMYQEAEVYLGTNNSDPSRPDGISVTFDDQGNLVINEIIEFKSSMNALVSGLEKEQPEKTLDTIEDIVEMLNKIIDGEDLDNLKAKSPSLSESTKRYREFKLIGIQNRIDDELDSKKQIRLSPGLIYRIVLPNWEVFPALDDDHMQNRQGENVKIEISNSLFSKQDIHSIIKHLEKK